MNKAIRHEEMMGVFSPFPLSEELKDFYVDTSKERSFMNARENIVNSFKYGINPYMKILFMGHKGCGKSTEIVHISDELKNQYCVLNFSVAKEVEIVGLKYVDVVFLILDQLISFVYNSKDVDVSTELLADIEQCWRQERIKETTSSEYIGMEASAGAKLGILDKLFLEFKGIFRSGSESKTVLRSRMEPKLGTLIQQINDVVTNINQELKAKANKELLIVVEDLDKLDIKEAQEIFVMHRKSLTALKMKMLFSFPIFMVYTPDFAMIQDDFDNCFFYSMIKVTDSNHERYEPGITVMKEIALKRMEESLVDDEALDYMIIKSGGAIRDLFKMLKNAALYVLSEGKDIIDTEVAEMVAAMLKSDYIRNITSENQYKKLISVYNEPKQNSTDTELAELLQTQSVIEYNGERWLGVHPVLIDFLKEKKSILI